MERKGEIIDKIEKGKMDATKREENRYIINEEGTVEARRRTVLRRGVEVLLVCVKSSAVRVQ